MSTFRSILPFNLKEGVTTDEFESFINDEYKPAYLAVKGFLNLELLKKQRSKILYFEQPSPDYLIMEFWESSESHGQVWKQESMEAVRTTLGIRVVNA